MAEKEIKVLYVKKWQAIKTLISLLELEGTVIKTVDVEQLWRNGNKYTMEDIEIATIGIREDIERLMKKRSRNEKSS